MDENNFQNFNPQMNDNMSFNQPGQYQQYQAPQPQYQQPIDNGFQPQPQPQPKKKKGGVVALIIILVLIIALCGGAAAYYFLVVKSPKTAINTFLDNIDSKLGEATELIEGNSELSSFKFSINVDPATSLSSDYAKTLKLLDNSNIEISVGIDKINKKASLNLTVNYNNDPITLSIFFDSESKGVYVYSKEILGKTIKVAEATDETVESFINSLSNSSDTKNYVKAAQFVVKAIKNNIKDDMISSSEGTYTANGKEVKATKNTITLTTESMKKLIYNVCNELQNNSEFINLFKTEQQTTIKSLLSSVTTSQDDTVSTTDSTYSVKSTAEISVYTDGFIPKATRYEYTVKNELSPELQKMLSNYSTSSSNEIDYSNPENLTSTIALNIIDDNNYEFIYKSLGKETKTDIKVKSNNKNNSEVSVVSNVDSIGTISVNMAYNRELNREIPVLPTASAIALNQLTTSDIQKLVTDLSAHEITKPFATYAYYLLLASSYRQSSATSNYSSLYGNSTNTNSYSSLYGTNNTSLTNSTSTVPEGKQKVGDKDNGYVLIPSNWTRFIDPDATATLQYSYANVYILTMMNVDTTQLSAYQYASNYAKNMQSEGVQVTTATVKVGEYTAYQVYGKYVSDNTWLVAWFFETQNGKTHCISVEGPDASNEAFSIPDTFTLD